MKPSNKKPAVTIEVCLKETCTEDTLTIKNFTSQLLPMYLNAYTSGTLDFDRETLQSICSTDEDLATTLYFLDQINVITIDSPKPIQSSTKPVLDIFVYQPSIETPCDEMIEDDADQVPTHFLYTIPHASFEGAWESLYFSSSIKDDLLNYAKTAMHFAHCKVDPNIISLNRVLMLHGPPGTGKTTLCKSLAQKLAIRLSDTFEHAIMVEINAHSLFSKWFSESGKLVMKVFSKIRDITEDPSTLVCVLIDEVESLAAARSSSLNNSEPSDAIRVVNAILTQLDSLKAYSNTLVLTTSNITGAIDGAFLDRVDMSFFVGPPDLDARYKILESCLEELVRVGIVHISPDEEYDCIVKLREVAEKSKGKSGRSLRKLVLKAFASHIRSKEVSFSTFMSALENSV